MSDISTRSDIQLLVETFYRELLLERRNFGEAVHEARKAVWKVYPEDITWGAFQAYGDAGWMAELAAWAKRLPRPRAIVVVSAHWEERPASIGATKPVPLIYDFGGFPDRFYRLQYRSPGAPEVAALVAQRRSLAEAIGAAVG